VNIFLIRHGMPVNGKKYRGNLVDDPLSKEGMSSMVRSVKGKNFDLVISSPMTRCLDFAKFLSIKMKIKLLIRDELKEVGFGDWQGKNSNQIGLEKIKRFKSNPVKFPVKNAEPLDSFFNRVISSYEKIVFEYKNYKNILIVTHAGVIRAILTHENNGCLEDMYKIEIKNSEMIKILR